MEDYTGENLMTFYEIEKYYGNLYRFYYIYTTNKNELHSFVRYIQKNFALKGHFNLNKIFSKKISDAKFYKILRKHYPKSVSQMELFQRKIYEIKIPRKVDAIYKNTFSLLKDCKAILDIGTESDFFITALQDKMNCNVIGINIESGFSHYVSYEEAIKSGKIFTYDGIHFPFSDKQFDLSILTSVIHHVNYPLDEFMEQVCRISKNIYIKEDDIINTESKYIQEIIHELYDGILMPNKPHPIYPITNQQLVEILEKNNFKIIFNKINDYFTRPFVLVAQYL
jgi:SAM-dependent methyltransferase